MAPAKITAALSLAAVGALMLVMLGAEDDPCPIPGSDDDPGQFCLDVPEWLFVVSIVVLVLSVAALLLSLTRLVRKRLPGGRSG